MKKTPKKNKKNLTTVVKKGLLGLKEMLSKGSVMTV